VSRQKSDKHKPERKAQKGTKAIVLQTVSDHNNEGVLQRKNVQFTVAPKFHKAAWQKKAVIFSALTFLGYFFVSRQKSDKHKPERIAQKETKAIVLQTVSDHDYEGAQ
jgi:hypothetical protein